MDQQTAVPKMIRSCTDCGQEFTDLTLAGAQFGRYCPDCREQRTRQLELDRQQHHQASLAHHRQEWLSDPVRGIPPRFQGMTWHDFKYDHGGEKNRRKVEELQDYAASFPVEQMPKGVKSLLVTREVNGVGKTMLACLILQDIINRFDQTAREHSPFQFWSVGRVKQRLRAAERFGSNETVKQVIQNFATMWLLVLDDVGKEKLAGADTAFSCDMYYTIINERYNNRLPIILTSNLSFEPVDRDGLCLTDLVSRAGVSRLMEMTDGTAYVIEGEERR